MFMDLKRPSQRTQSYQADLFFHRTCFSKRESSVYLSIPPPITSFLGMCELNSACDLGKRNGTKMSFGQRGPMLWN